MRKLMGIISQRKQLEEKLAESEKQYYAVFNNIPNPVFVLDMNTLTILDCNQSIKMATLGEMATGVAHELNQPLSVIKTASSFFMKKISRKEPIKEEILYTLSQEIDSHVDRATRIINHMRLFGRKSEMTLEKIFEPFFTTKKVGKGTGLGLSISYSFIKECQGDIRAVNNRDGGSTFILSFPRATDS